MICPLSSKGQAVGSERMGDILFFCLFFPNSVSRQAPLFLKIILINLFLTVLGLHYCSKQGLLSSCDSQLLNAMASLAAERGLEDARASVGATPVLSSCGSWALEHRLSGFDPQAELLLGMWDLPGPGIGNCVFFIGRWILYQ